MSELPQKLRLNKSTSDLTEFLLGSNLPKPSLTVTSNSQQQPQENNNNNEFEKLTNDLPKFSSIRVISLLERIDRRNHMKKLDEFLKLGFKFSNGILFDDPRVIEIVNRIGNNTKADNKKAEVGHVACRLSHHQAILAADKDDDEITLILEDDVDIEAAFKYLSGTILRDVPKDWDMIFFGHTDFSDESRHGRKTKNFLIYESVEPQGGHAYGLSRKGRKLILELLKNSKPEFYETDEGQPIDEIYMNLNRLNKIKSYSIIPDLIIQKSLFKSDIFGTPPGFKDGMHNKFLLDSSLDRINQFNNHDNDDDHHQQTNGFSNNKAHRHRLSRSFNS